jgi:hypothetical protein
MHLVQPRIHEDPRSDPDAVDSGQVLAGHGGRESERIRGGRGRG